MKKLLLGTITAALLTLAGAAQASLVMNVYSGAGNGGVAGVQAAINNSTPTSITVATVIDHWDGSGSAGDYSNNFAFPGGVVDNFGVNFIGFLNVVTAGTYDFRSLSDDGVQLKIDGNMLFSSSIYSPPFYTFGSTFLSAGAHAIDFIFFEGGGGATVELAAKTGNNPYLLLGSVGGLQTSTVPVSVPEPASLALFGAALAGLAATRRRRTKG